MEDAVSRAEANGELVRQREQRPAVREVVQAHGNLCMRDLFGAEEACRY